MHVGDEGVEMGAYEELGAQLTSSLSQCAGLDAALRRLHSEHLQRWDASEEFDVQTNTMLGQLYRLPAPDFSPSTEKYADLYRNRLDAKLAISMGLRNAGYEKYKSMRSALVEPGRSERLDRMTVKGLGDLMLFAVARAISIVENQRSAKASAVSPDLSTVDLLPLDAYTRLFGEDEPSLSAEEGENLGTYL